MFSHRQQFLAERFARFGSIFQTHLDFSGSYLLARKVVCIDVNLAKDVPRIGLKCLGWTGLYGSCCASADKVSKLAKLVLNDRDYLQHWETISTPIIRKVLARLIYKPQFSFADKVNQLACELVGTAFLGMDGLDPDLLAAFDEYLHAAQHERSFQGQHTAKHQVIANAISAAVFEEDRQFYDSAELIPDSRESVLSNILDVCGALLDEGHTDSDRYDLFFAFIVDCVYRQLVNQLRACVHCIVVDKTDMSVHALQQYQEYLQGRQARRLTSDRGLRQFAWANAVMQAMGDGADDEEEEQEETKEDTNATVSDSGKQAGVGEGSKENFAVRALNAAWSWITSASKQGPDEQTAVVGYLSSMEEEQEEETKEENAAASADRLTLQLPPIPSPSASDRAGTNQSVLQLPAPLPHSFLSTPPCGGQQLIQHTPGSVFSYDDIYRRTATPEKKSASVRSNASSGRAMCTKHDVLADAYVHSVQDIVMAAGQAALPEMPMQSSLHIAEDAFIVQRSSGEAAYPVHANDLVLLLHHPHILDSASGLDAQGGALGGFAQVVLSVFAHELLTGYRWTYVAQPSLDKPHTQDPVGFCSLPDGSLRVRSLRKVKAVPFYIEALVEEPEDEDERYFSDGL